MTNTDARPALAAVPDLEPPMSWWLIRDRVYNKLWPVRTFLFRRYYQIDDLKGEVRDLERQLAISVRLQERVVDYLLAEQEQRDSQAK